MATVTVHRGPEAESGLAQRLRREIEGEVLFDAFTRGRYSTDASIYQIEPLGVVIPATSQDIAAAIAIAREEGVPVLPRGGGTSQCGQTVNRGAGDRHQPAPQPRRWRSTPRPRARSGSSPASSSTTSTRP